MREAFKNQDQKCSRTPQIRLWLAGRSERMSDTVSKAVAPTNGREKNKGEN